MTNNDINTRTEDYNYLYRVIVGTYNTKAAAEEIAYKAALYGFSTREFLEKDGRHSVQCGIYKNENTATDIAGKLRIKGFVDARVEAIKLKGGDK